MIQEHQNISTHHAEASELWYHIYQTLQAGIIVSVNSMMQEANDTALRLIGAHSQAEIKNKSFHKTLLFPENISKAQERELSLRSGNPAVPPMEIRIKRLDGGSIDVLISATSWRNGNDVIIESMLIDISLLKRHERLLEAVSKMMVIIAKEDLFVDSRLAREHVLSAMHVLYAEMHNCGYVMCSDTEHEFMESLGITEPDVYDQSIFSFRPLSDEMRRWIIRNTGTIARDAFEINDTQELVVFEPFSQKEKARGFFFWIFEEPLSKKMLKEDSARRNNFILSLQTTLDAIVTRRENIQKRSDLAILHYATLEIGKMQSMQEIADAVLDILAKEKSWAPSVIRFKKRQTGDLETIAFRGIPGISKMENAEKMHALDKVINRSKKGLIGEVIRTGHAILSEDLQADPRNVETAPEIKYGMYAPIVIDSETEGAIGIESSLYKFTESDLKLLSSMSEIISMTLTSVRLIEILRERVSWLEALHKINQKIGIEAKPQEFYEILVEETVCATNAESAALLIYNADTQRLEFRAGMGWLKDCFSQPLQVGRGISSHVFATGKTHISPSLLNDPLFLKSDRVIIPPGRSNICVPVVAEGAIFGVFHIALKTQGKFNKEFVELVEIIGTYAGIMIGRLQHTEALKRAENKLQTAYDETLEGWSRAIGIRDDETFMHTERVAKIASILGRECNLDAKDLENLKRGALLHDVGKIGIPDTILRKPSVLSSEERQIMQTHASFGYELLKPISYLEDALVVPYCHHERWDGTGYPRNLRGEEIPLLARIFAIADVYDAMTSNRSYRVAFSRQEALDYIKAQAGKHFDPRIVDIFLKISDIIEE